MRAALARERGLASRELLLGALELLRKGVGVRLRVARVPFGRRACGALLVKAIAEPAAERGADDQPDGAAREHADRGAAAEPDRLLFLRMVLLDVRPLAGPARVRGQAAGQEDDDGSLHGSLLEAW